ncbi:MAG TPA: GAF domain-containing protein [Ktedonobacteraceae bacterium]|nr:GAF domain-containing protein [Ktedonobacteraceae bacterium]
MNTPLNDALVARRATRSSNRSGVPNTRLRGRKLILARVAWVTVAGLVAAIFLARLPVYYTALQAVCTGTVCGYVQPTLDTAQALQKLGLSVSAYAALTLALEIALAFLCFTLGTVIFWRRSDDWMALLGALAVVASVTLNGNVFSMDMSSAWGWIGMGLFVFGGGMYLVVLSLFDGRFVTRWAPLVLLCWAVAIIHYFMFMNFVYSLIWGAALGLLLIAQAYHHRTTANPIQRQQSKWFIFGGCVQFLIAAGTLVPPLIFPSLWQAGSFYQLVNALVLIVLSFIFPMCIGIAILRYRLYDIDIIIRRTLVYGILTVCVVGVYVLVVGTLGAFIGTSGNLLISLVATGLVAVLFQPLRAVLQRGINRLLYGQRDEPYTVITHLSQRLEGQISPDAVLSTIVETVAQALKLPYAAILLKQEDKFRLAASAGDLMGEPLVLPLVYQADTVGQMHLALRTPGEPFTPADRRLLDELARQAGLAAHAVQLAGDLQRSYEQLEQRVQERTRELSTLLEVSHNVASTIELKPLLDLILDQLKVVVEYTGSAIAIVEHEDVVFVGTRGPLSEEHVVQRRFPLARMGPIWEKLCSGEPVIIDNVRNDTSLAQAYRETVDELLETTFRYVRSWVAVPLKLREHVIGMLSASHTQPDYYTSHHADLALAIANQAAVAIENARLYERAQELAALEERQKLARELHDSVSQALYGISLGVHTARTLLDRDPRLVAEPLEYVLSLAKTGLAEMRALIFELRPESLETEGLVSALIKQAAALQARHDVPVETNMCDEPDLSLPVKQELYRVTQEALHNTIKHAHASQVNVRLGRTAEAIILEIQDNGRGFDSLGSFPGHLGLLSMRERINHLGGVLGIESTPGHGTTIHASVPAREVIHP